MPLADYIMVTLIAPWFPCEILALYKLLLTYSWYYFSSVWSNVLYCG